MALKIVFNPLSGTFDFVNVVNYEIDGGLPDSLYLVEQFIDGGEI